MAKRDLTVRAVIRRLLLFAGRRLVPHSTKGPFQLVVFSGEASAEEFFTKIGAALDLIQQTDARRFDRIQEDLSQFGLVAAGGGFYDADIRTYVVDMPALQRSSVEEVAITIVHEAAHARLRAAGVKRTRDNAARIETICVGQEVEFAQRLPNGQSFVESARRKLAKPWWGREEIERRHDAMLRSLGWPPCFSRRKTR